MLLEQVLDSLRWLSAVRQPVLDATEIDAEPLFAAFGDRVEEPYALDITPTTWSASIRHDHVIERTLVGTAACQPNDDHSRETFRSQKK